MIPTEDWLVERITDLAGRVETLERQTNHLASARSWNTAIICERCRRSDKVPAVAIITIGERWVPVCTEHLVEGAGEPITLDQVMDALGGTGRNGRRFPRKRDA